MGRKFVCRLSWVTIAAGLLLPIGGAWAESLPDAFIRAYLGNPALRAARAGLRATDEQVPQALSGWRPTVTVQGNVQHSESSVTSFDSVTKKMSTTATESDTGELTITLQQPIFRGFQTVESTKAAEANVRAGRQNLLATEQGVLFNAVEAYMNVYSGRQLVALQQENAAVLQAQLRASNERFKVGEITRTDVAQARASLSQAKAALANARATLAGDVAEYLQIIGNEPGKLTYPKVSRLPSSLNAALGKAAEINPSILAAAFVEVASIHNIKVARAPLLPQASLQAQATLADDFAAKGGHSESASIAGVVTIPLYEAGAVYSRVRQAKQLASQQRIQTIEVERAVRQAVAAAWNFLTASREIISAAKDQVAAARMALDGVQQEYAAGTRTTLDVLNAQAAVVTARTTLVNAEESRVVAAYQLLASIGHLTARNMALKVPYYDAEENYHVVRDKWIGTGADTVE
jgi:outer membrane protein